MQDTVVKYKSQQSFSARIPVRRPWSACKIFELRQALRCHSPATAILPLKDDDACSAYPRVDANVAGRLEQHGHFAGLGSLFCRFRVLLSTEGAEISFERDHRCGGELEPSAVLFICGLPLPSVISTTEDSNAVQCPLLRFFKGPLFWAYSAGSLLKVILGQAVSHKGCQLASLSVKG